MSEGVLIFAHNNTDIDYAELAYISAVYVKKNLSKPVSLVTDSGSRDWMLKKYPDSINIFDQIIITDNILLAHPQKKRYYDGALSHKLLTFNNLLRSKSYDLSPYDKTLVIDCDLLIVNDRLKYVWESNEDFMISKEHHSLASDFDDVEFQKISDYSVDFVWATAFYFVKNEKNNIFFDLCKHIVENYDFYRFVYRIDNPLMRNDYVFSIAHHILSGFSNEIKPVSLPSEIFYTLDKEELYDVHDNKTFVFLTNKKNYLGEYILVKTHNQNVHIMNKYAFGRNAKKLLEVIS